MKIGKRIQELRKEQNVTQEALGNAVGVTTQAVSKWENGGTPDAELLPSIADYFQVSIDCLFGRSSAEEISLSNYVFQQIHQLAPEKRNDEIYKVCHSLMMASSTVDEISQIIKAGEYPVMDKNGLKFGCHITTDYSLSFISLVEQTPYCFILPESKEGFAASFASNEKNRELFNFLGQEHVLEVLIEFHRFPYNKGLTSELIAKRCGLKDASVESILKRMYEMKWLDLLEIETSTSLMNIYILNQFIALVPFMILAEELIDPAHVGYFLTDRAKPILNPDMQRNGKTPK